MISQEKNVNEFDELLQKRLQRSTPLSQKDYFKKIWYFLAPYKKQMIFALVALLITSGAILFIGQGIRRLMSIEFINANPDFMHEVLMGLMGLSGIIILGGYIRYYFSTWLGERVVADIRLAALKKILTLDASFFETIRTGEIVARLISDTATLQNVINYSATLALRNFITILGSLILLVFLNFQLFLYVFLFFSITMSLMVFFGLKIRKISTKLQLHTSDIAAETEEKLYSLRGSSIFFYEIQALNRLKETIHQSFTTGVELARTRAMMSSVIIACSFISFIGLFWMGDYQISAQKITTGDLGGFIFYTFMLILSTSVFAHTWADLEKAMGSLSRLMDIIDLPSIVSSKNTDFLPFPKVHSTTLQFEDVSFAYPARKDVPVLSDINFTIHNGEHIAFVGPSGAGKSTLLKLILRFYEADTGKIYLNSHLLSHISMDNLCEHIAFVPQEPSIFSTSILDNIRISKPHASQDDIYNALKASQALDFIEKLPQGLHTRLGEKGIRLSQGQRQRLAIARAILKNPALLLLDEPTNTLDEKNAVLIHEALNHLMHKRTSIIVAHSLSSILQCDRIAFIHQGKIKDFAPHKQLIKKNASYANLMNLKIQC